MQRMPLLGLHCSTLQSGLSHHCMNKICTKTIHTLTKMSPYQLGQCFQNAMLFLCVKKLWTIELINITRQLSTYCYSPSINSWNQRPFLSTTVSLTIDTKPRKRMHHTPTAGISISPFHSFLTWKLVENLHSWLTNDDKSAVSTGRECPNHCWLAGSLAQYTGSV